MPRSGPYTWHSLSRPPVHHQNPPHRAPRPFCRRTAPHRSARERMRVMSCVSIASTLAGRSAATRSCLRGSGTPAARPSSPVTAEPRRFFPSALTSRHHLGGAKAGVGASLRGGDAAPRGGLCGIIRPHQRRLALTVTAAAKAKNRDTGRMMHLREGKVEIADTNILFPDQG